MLTSREESPTITNPIRLPTITTFLWENTSPHATQIGATTEQNLYMYWHDYNTKTGFQRQWQNKVIIIILLKQYRAFFSKYVCKKTIQNKSKRNLWNQHSKYSLINWLLKVTCTKWPLKVTCTKWPLKVTCTKLPLLFICIQWPCNVNLF